MTDPTPQLAILRDPRLAVHALAPAPVWLWSPDADRILWANPAGAAIFDAASPGAAALLRFDASHSASVQVARLSDTLPQAGTPRLERLRGFGASFGATLVCLCSRVALAGDSAAILIASAERAGKSLALPDRATRLLRDLGPDTAIFTADGETIAAHPAAIERMGHKRDLVALGAEKLAREASLNDMAEGDIAAGHITMIKLGAGSTFGLLAIFSEPTQKRSTPRAGAQTPKIPNPVESQLQSRPFRFVWKTDAETRFTVTSREFADLLGTKSAAVLGLSWAEVAKTLTLDPVGEIANALSRHETFSGIETAWPIEGLDQPLTVEMSGLPMFDSDRRFGGFRGFGLCRDVDRLKDLQSRKLDHNPGAPSEPAKVLPFPAAPAPAAPALSPKEHVAFQELARELSERLRKTSGKSSAPVPLESSEPVAAPAETPQTPKPARDTLEDRTIFERLPTGILVYRLNSLIYANRAFLDWSGYSTLDQLTEAGGLDSLFIEPKKEAAKDLGATKSLTIATSNGKQKPVEGRLFSVTWSGESALALMIDTQPNAGGKQAEASPQRGDEEIRELRAILDTATDGVLILNSNGRVLSGNRSAQALFGYDAGELGDLSLSDLLVPESHRPVLEHLERLARRDGVDSLGAGYEAIGRVRQGGLVPLHITIGRIEDGEKLCVVLRDITAWKRSEEELINAKRAAEKASTAKSEFLAKISHEIRTPLNAIIGFSEVMMDERFGPIGSERYRQYLKDIHASGGHLISLLNDLLDLSKIEAGKLELTFVSVNLNDLVQQCVAIMQQQANRERVIIRTSLHANLPQIVADARAMRQIMLNLLSNSIKFTGAGGQVIISTAQTDDHEVVLRVRDTGSGMSEKELQIALEPFRQVPTVTWDAGGTGLGLPITKALAEANQAYFRITSRVDEGTLAEVIFPVTRVLAQ
ncbi:MAG TPA: PAS domain-containing sensor histidine kinase [Pseudolabrys sp.]|nr:PAS domain-containing sensor histidine kinase [Pseudolabrys sp.]